MKNIKIKNMNSKIVIIFILGLICFSSLGLNNTSDFISKNEDNMDEIPPRSSVFLENRTDYSKQLVLDSQFDIEEISSPWTPNEEPDITDVDTNLDLSQANYIAIGENNTFSSVNGIPQSSDWTSMQNSEFPAYPEWPVGGADSYGIDSDGVWASHAWAEGPKQTPSIQWHRNFTLPHNMSDYTITSANVSAIINGSVDSNIDVNQALGDTPDGSNDATPQGIVYDYVRFYVSIADTSLENIYEIASYQTFELGLYIDAGNNILDIERYMDMVLEENLLFYLTQVLSSDHENFTVILGMNILCEDNCWSDEDFWDSLRIKNVNFTFSYEKNIDQLTSASWNQTGNVIDNGEYELGDDGYFIVNNASLDFDYNSSLLWPDSSLNSEIRVFINNYQISKTIKLTNFTNSSLQNEIFDISPSILNVSENVTIKIQLYLADNFQLSENITFTIDNVNLITHFTVVERRNPIPTTLETTAGYLSRSIPWNEDFVVFLNYTNASNQVGIDSGDFIVEWSDSFEISDDGNGIYNISCDNSLDVSSLAYTLKISVNTTDTWYESKTLELKIYVVGRETNSKILLEDEDITSSDEFDVPITKQLSFTLFYFDTVLSDQLQDFDISLSGLDSSSYTSSHNSTAYNFVINTSKLGLGLHIASFLTEKTNYEAISKNFQINVRQIHTNITTTHANQSFTIETGQDFDLLLFIEDVDFGGNISGCEVSYSSSLGSGVIDETEFESYSVSFNDVAQGIYTIYISVFIGPEYKFDQFEITLNVINPITSDQGIPDFVFYIMGVLMIGLIASFVAYQQYFKFPKSVREIKSLSKAIKKGKAAEKELSVKTANDLFVEDYVSKTKGSLPSKNKALMKDRMGTGSSQKSMSKGDIKKGEKVELKEKKITPEVPKKVKKPDTPRKPSPLEESLELPKSEQPKKVEPPLKIEKIKPDQFVKPKDIEKRDIKPGSKDPKPKKIRYLRKPKIKELPKKTAKKPKKD